MATTNITEKDVLDFFGLDSKKYKAQRLTSSKTYTEKYAAATNKQEFDSSEWIIYKIEKTNNSQKLVEVKPSQFTSNNKSYNKCAINGERGIIITNKKTFVQEKSKGSASTTPPTFDETTNFSYMSSYGGVDGESVMGWFEAVNFGPEGHDEKIIKQIQFARLGLLKECYEWVGINLSTNSNI